MEVMERAGRQIEQSSIYQPTQAGLKFPKVPHFQSLAAEREYRKKHLVAACRAFALHGFDYGFAGHLTVRDPEYLDFYWTNPMAVHFSLVNISNLVLANHQGEVVQGSHAINRAGFVLDTTRSACYRHPVPSMSTRRQPLPGRLWPWRRSFASHSRMTKFNRPGYVLKSRCER